ncbi:hypothetical protein N7468_009873 [Penicillium chermesinum]|uniref:BZIP domain-containing protein n=1 Tax=Penicillium chermesinum TaxID=63820 RepID=A0A9W9NBM3_9EURO|nr:uncharacterized protein N7468_009873 [Penicillium chermesinum]KAJ5216865.1 hypothetical protein N7468_009873 [Penicillium chermesinum]KAJ6171518.1 hypothetical protein N7470_000585 [Penicillium chermesinum]
MAGPRVASSGPGPAGISKAPDMIEVTYDESGSTSQAKKRKANREASKKYRQRKSETQHLKDLVRDLRKEIKTLREEKSRCNSERDLLVGRSNGLIPAHTLSSQPHSPPAKLSST